MCSFQDALFPVNVHHKKTLVKINAIIDFIRNQKTVTIRQLFYHLVVKGLVENKLSAYGSLCKLVTNLRYNCEIPFNSIADSTSLYGTCQYESLDELLNKIKSTYRSNWNIEFSPYMEVWLEKEALTNIVQPITNSFGVYLSVSSGRTKISQVHSFINRANKYDDKSALILYLGDFDPTGLNIDENLNEQFNKQSQYIEFPDITVKRIAITEQQLCNLPRSYQTAKPTDPNYEVFTQKYGFQVWELDAFTPSELKDIVLREIEKYRTADKIEALEERDREEIENIWR